MEPRMQIESPATKCAGGKDSMAGDITLEISNIHDIAEAIIVRVVGITERLIGNTISKDPDEQKKSDPVGWATQSMDDIVHIKNDLVYLSNIIDTLESFI